MSPLSGHFTFGQKHVKIQEKTWSSCTGMRAVMDWRRPGTSSLAAHCEPPPRLGYHRVPRSVSAPGRALRLFLSPARSLAADACASSVVALYLAIPCTGGAAPGHRAWHACAWGNCAWRWRGRARRKKWGTHSSRERVLCARARLRDVWLLQPARAPAELPKRPGNMHAKDGSMVLGGSGLDAVPFLRAKCLWCEEHS